MKTLTNLNQIDKQKWQLLLEKSPYTSPFQTIDFFEFYNHQNNCSADVFAIEENEQYVALAVVTLQKESGIKSYFSSRAIIHGGVLSINDNAETVEKLLYHVREHFRSKVIYVEIRNYFDYSTYKTNAESVGFKYIKWLNYQFCDITPDTFIEGMKKPRYRQLRNALNNGAQWREAASVKDVKDFYEILSKLYKHKVKKPLPSFDYFENLYNSAFAKCLIVEKDRTIIGGVMCLKYRTKVLYEFYICGEDKVFSDCRPSIVAMWAMIEYASQNGIKNIDLMGAGQPEKPNSVREFKSKFGGELVENGRFLLVCKPLLYALGKFYIKMISG